MIKVHATVPALDQAMQRLNIRNAAAIQVDNVVYLSGLTALDLATGEMVLGDIGAHAHQTLALCKLVLEDIGLSLDHVVKVNCFLNDAADFAAWNEVYLDVFDAPYPCRTTVGACLVVGLIEVEMIAALEPRRGSGSASS